jgi:hypothetical protein
MAPMRAFTMFGAIGIARKSGNRFSAGSDALTRHRTVDAVMAHSNPTARLLIQSRMAEALKGDAGACFDLGIALASGVCSRGDLLEAHKWFTLASLAGYRPARKSGDEVARRMSAADQAKAQRRARAAQLAARLFV